MFSVAPNIVFAPNMTQNAERKHRTQDTNTANFRSFSELSFQSRILIPYEFDRNQRTAHFTIVITTFIDMKIELLCVVSLKC